MFGVPIRLWVVLGSANSARRARVVRVFGAAVGGTRETSSTWAQQTHFPAGGIWSVSRTYTLPSAGTQRKR
eukprot:88374-Prorocentrum_lima.AAC.1